VNKEKQTVHRCRAAEPVEGLEEIGSGFGHLAQVGSEVRGGVRRASRGEAKSGPFRSAAE
jgi:hypothetical protein